MGAYDDLLKDDDDDAVGPAPSKSSAGTGRGRKSQARRRSGANRMHHLKTNSAEYHYAQQYRTPFTENRKKVIFMLLALYPLVSFYFLFKIVDLGEFGTNTQWATFLAILCYGVGLFLFKTTDSEDMLPPSMIEEED